MTLDRTIVISLPPVFSPLRSTAVLPEHSQPISVVIVREVRPGCECDFETALREWVPQAVAFPGHLGVLLLTPPPGGNEYGAILKFRTASDWTEFQKWPPYLNFLQNIRPLLATEPRVFEADGLEAWFASMGVQSPPAHWKLAFVTWIGVNLTAYVLTLTLKPATESWPFILSFITFNAGVVAGLTWLVMPLLTRLFRPWLHRR